MFLINNFFAIIQKTSSERHDENALNEIQSEGSGRVGWQNGKVSLRCQYSVTLTYECPFIFVLGTLMEGGGLNGHV